MVRTTTNLFVRCLLHVCLVYNSLFPRINFNVFNFVVVFFLRIPRKTPHVADGWWGEVDL